MANFPGRRVYPIQTNFTPARDGGNVTTLPPTGLARGLARRVYPTQTNLTPARDGGEVTTLPPAGLPRGGLTADFDVTLRHTGKRIDIKPKRPYP